MSSFIASGTYLFRRCFWNPFSLFCNSIRSAHTSLIFWIIPHYLLVWNDPLRWWFEFFKDDESTAELYNQSPETCKEYTLVCVYVLCHNSHRMTMIRANLMHSTRLGPIQIRTSRLQNTNNSHAEKKTRCFNNQFQTQAHTHTYNIIQSWIILEKLTVMQLVKKSSTLQWTVCIRPRF